MKPQTSNFKFNVPTIIGKLIEDSYNPFTKMDKREELASFCGYANDFRIKLLIKQKDLQFPTAQKALSFFGYSLYAIRENAYEIASVSSAIVLIKSFLKEKKIKQIDYAKMLNITEVALYKYFKQPNIKIGTLIKMFNVLDYEVVAKNNTENKKDFILGFDSVYDETFEKNFDEYSLSMPELTKTHHDFLNEFFEHCVEENYNSKVRCSILYKAYEEFWNSNRRNQPKTFTNKSDKPRNTYGQLGRKEFKIACCCKYGFDGDSFVGIQLKENIQ